MKKLLVFIFSVGLISATTAQVQFSAGLKAGPNFTKLSVDNSISETYKSRSGFHAGAFMLFKISKVGIQPEILYSRQGTSFKLAGENLKSNFDYFNVPIIVKLYTVAGINLQIGPQFGFLTGAGGDTAVDTDSGTGVIDNSKKLYKKSDVSAAFGVGWDLPFGLMVEGRYNLGLTKIQDNPDLEATKNQVFQISLGYKFIKIGK